MNLQYQYYWQEEPDLGGIHHVHISLWQELECTSVGLAFYLAPSCKSLFPCRYHARIRVASDFTVHTGSRTHPPAFIHCMPGTVAMLEISLRDPASHSGPSTYFNSLCTCLSSLTLLYDLASIPSCVRLAASCRKLLCSVTRNLLLVQGNRSSRRLRTLSCKVMF